MPLSSKAQAVALIRRYRRLDGWLFLIAAVVMLSTFGVSWDFWWRLVTGLGLIALGGHALERRG